MKKETEKIEIPFGAKDSELYKFEYTIPEGYEARIEDGKVIVTKKESEDERIIGNIKKAAELYWSDEPLNEILSWLEKQKDKRELDFAEGRVEGVKQTCQEIKDAMSLFEPKDLTPFELTFRDYIDSAIRYCLSGEGYQQYIKEWAADLLNLEKNKEQKPAEWSERHIADVFEKVGLSKIAREQGNDALTNAVQSAMIELSKIGNAVWSEKDEDMLNSIIATCQLAAQDKESGPARHLFEMQESFLKSLRSRPKSSDNLKPCEYTLSLVKKVADGEMLTCMEQMAIGTLYEDLKKL